MGKLNTIANAKAYMAMCDVKWQDYLHSTNHDAIMKVYHAEWDVLKASILIELDPSHPEHAEAVRCAMGGRCILKFKCMGVWKVRVVVVHGYEEDKVYLDGEGFDYTTNMCEIRAVRNLLFEPHDSPYSPKSSKTNDKSKGIDNAAPDSDPIIIRQADVRTAYLQSDHFRLDKLKCYLKEADGQTWNGFSLSSARTSTSSH